MRLIDADTLKEAIKSDMYVVDYGVEGAIYGMFWSGIENAIDEQPTVEQLDEISDAYENGYQQGKFEGRKTGKWLYGATETGALNIQYREYICSECGWSHSLMIPRNYCPNCGAKMEVEDD